MHGPGHYQTGINREILLAFRYTIIVSAGTLRQPCFLAEPDWRSVIQLNEAESRDVFDTLLNVAVDVPGLLYGSDRFTDGQMSDTELASLSITLQWAMRELEVWWRTSFSDASVANDSSSIYSPLNASAIAFHHMVLLLLEDLCYNLNVPWRPTSILSPPATSFSNDASIMDMDIRAQRRHVVASEILHLARCSICPETGMYGALRFVMPLHVAHDYLIPASPETHDLHDLMNTVVAEQHGFHMAKRYDGQYTSFRKSLIIKIPLESVDF
ncbi:hypothetical protein DPV78_010954 [Talaromyces pinophilus]|nr:hypothetical protein DPV78_010954 [Talaromyces pinophilus]